MEALRSGRDIDKILIQKGGEGSIKKIEGMAKDLKISIQYLDRNALARISGTDNHQGVVAYVSSYPYKKLSELVSEGSESDDPFIVILDGLEDPHNLGAIIRTADGAGAHGVVIGKHRSAGITPTVVKASAGAVEYVSVAKVNNMVSAIEELKKVGLWICGCDMGGEVYWEKDLTGPIALVVGGEGKGLSRLVREHCDFVVSIPMKGGVNSLNVSNAAAVIMYEIKRQRAKKVR